MYRPVLHYCSNCGAQIGLESIAGDSIKRYYCKACDTIHYTNPKLIVGVLPYWEDRILLCRRAIEPRLGYWNLPAGFLENNELAEEGAKRECWEEAEARVDLEGILAVYSLPQANQIYVHFYGRLMNGEFGVGVESSECRLFTEAEIPWGDMAFASSTFALKKFLEDRKNGDIRAHIGHFVWK